MLGKHKVVVNADHEALIKERKSKNTEKQLTAYKKEVEQLNAKIDRLSGVDQMLQQEQSAVDSKEYQLELQKKIKDLEKINKDQGDALEKITEGDEFQYQIKNLIDEIRMWKEKSKKIEQIALQ